MNEVTKHNGTPAEVPHPREVIDDVVRRFHEFLLVDAGRARTTARVRKTIVASTLRSLGTPAPSPGQVEAAKRKMLLSGRTADHTRNFVFAFRDFFVFLGAPGASAQFAPPKKSPRRVPRFLTAEEVRAFLAAIKDPRDLALFYCLAYTGLRIHEVLKTRPEDVDVEARTMEVVGKGGKSAVIPIGEPAIPHLRAHLASRNHAAPTLFYQNERVRGTGSPLAALSAQRVRSLCRRYAKAAGLRRAATPHMFRHALATNLLENGCPLPFVQRQLRHARIETTMIYLHASDKAFRDNFDRFTPNYG